MQIQDHLDQLLNDAPGCSLATYGDLSSGLILKWSAPSPCPREVLDQLSEQSAGCFALLDPALLPEGIPAPEYGRAVMAFTDRVTRVFARSAEAPDDIVGAVFAPQTDANVALDLTREAAEKLASPQ